MGEIKQERVVWQPRERRKYSRRDVLKGLVLGVGPALAGAVFLGRKVIENQPFKGPEDQNSDQKVALALIEETRRKNEIIEAKIVNSDDPKERVTVRKTPGFLSTNNFGELKPGTRIDGIIVEQIPESFVDETGKYPRQWFAYVKPSGRVGFVNTWYVRRVDGQSLFQLGARIHNIRNQSSFPLAPSETSQR